MVTATMVMVTMDADGGVLHIIILPAGTEVTGLMVITETAFTYIIMFT